MSEQCIGTQVRAMATPVSLIIVKHNCKGTRIYLEL